MKERDIDEHWEAISEAFPDMLKDPKSRAGNKLQFLIGCLMQAAQEDPARHGPDVHAFAVELTSCWQVLGLSAPDGAAYIPTLEARKDTGRKKGPRLGALAAEKVFEEYCFIRGQRKIAKELMDTERELRKLRKKQAKKDKELAAVIAETDDFDFMAYCEQIAALPDFSKDTWELWWVLIEPRMRALWEQQEAYSEDGKTIYDTSVRDSDKKRNLEARADNDRGRQEQAAPSIARNEWLKECKRSLKASAQ